MRSAKITYSLVRPPASKYKVDFYGTDGTWWCHYYPSIPAAGWAWFKYVVIGY